LWPLHKIIADQNAAYCTQSAPALEFPARGQYIKPFLRTGIAV
jgi:hypothetical protein